MHRILLAEDEEVLRMLITDTLEDEGYIIKEASDGLGALACLKADNYDLIIMDYMMPGMTGLELIETIHSDEMAFSGKILMLSAKSQVYEQERILKAGADYFMAKPFSPLELAGKVRGILSED